MKTEVTNEPHPQGGENVVCPSCLLSNSKDAAFCADCGAPIGMVAAIDPIQHIHAEGFAYRSAVDGAPKPIVLIGIWLIFAPMAIGMLLLMITVRTDSTLAAIIPLLFTAVSIAVLYRATKNYVSKRQLANTVAD